MKAVVVDEVSDLREGRKAGTMSFRIRGDGAVGGIAFICPCGCGNESYLFLDGIGPAWEWNGSKDAATLTPSVFNTGMPCRWHGWLRDGYWVSV